MELGIIPVHNTPVVLLEVKKLLRMIHNCIKAAGAKIVNPEPDIILLAKQIPDFGWR